MKFNGILLALATACATASAEANSVAYEQWAVSGCSGRALVTATARQGGCINLGFYPGKSIRLTDNGGCPAGQSAWIQVSSESCATPLQVDGEFLADGQCVDLDFDPLAIVLSCRKA